MRAVVLSGGTWEIVGPGVMVVRLTPAEVASAKETGMLPDYPRIVQMLDCRWVILTKTSPSGKTQFACTCCGRVTIAPDKTCPDGCEDEELSWTTASTEASSDTPPHQE